MDDMSLIRKETIVDVDRIVIPTELRMSPTARRKAMPDVNFTAEASFEDFRPEIRL